MVNAPSSWAPLLVPKGFEVLNDYHRYLLVDGPKYSGKTMSILSKLCRHAFDNRDAMIGIVPKTTRLGKVGVWNDLIQTTIGHDWAKAPIGFKIVEGPKMQVDTKMSFMRVSNRFGGVSEFQIHSLEHAHEAPERFKSSRFSAIYMPEADHFEDRIVLDALADQLRSFTVPFEEMQLIVDCNPPEEGENHWLHEVFFKVKDDPQLTDEQKARFHRIPFCLADNTLADPRMLDDIRSRYAKSENQYARFVEGKWVRDTAKGHFSGIYTPSIHVVGDASHRNQDEWNIVVPTQQCTTLVSGWDMGNTWHAWALAAPREFEGYSAFDFIDEIFVEGQEISIADFTQAIVERMDYWEEFMATHYKRKIGWRHWSDDSATRYNSAADSRDELIVRNESEGRIVLSSTSALKRPGFVRKRLDLVKKLLWDKRITVSDQLVHLKNMFENLRPGRTKAEPIKLGSKEKHVFDAASYLLGSESPGDIESRIEPATMSSVVSV